MRRRSLLNLAPQEEEEELFQIGTSTFPGLSRVKPEREMTEWEKDTVWEQLRRQQVRVAFNKLFVAEFGRKPVTPGAEIMSVATCYLCGWKADAAGRHMLEGEWHDRAFGGLSCGAYGLGWFITPESVAMTGSSSAAGAGSSSAAGAGSGATAAAGEDARRRRERLSVPCSGVRVTRHFHI